MILLMMCCYDEYDVLNSASAEQVARRILMLRQGVKESPRSPDLENLEVHTANALDASDEVTVTTL
eukprot:5809390-Heterocapsa_arctica.AAC.1